MIDAQSGVSKSSGGRIGNKDGAYTNQGSTGWSGAHKAGDPDYQDTGGASRFFYTAKASSKERWCYCRSCKIAFQRSDESEKDSHADHAESVVMHPCLHPSSEVLTDNGWKQISTLSIGTPVLAADGEFHPAIDVSSHQASGPLYRITVHGGRTVEATGNHPFLVFRDGVVAWVEASLVRAGDETLTPLTSPVFHSTLKPCEHEELGTSQRRVTSESSSMDGSGCSTLPCGKQHTVECQAASRSTTRTETNRTTTCSTSNFSARLNTSGFTPVANSDPVSGGSHAGCAVCSSQPPRNTGTSREVGSAEGCAGPASSRRSSPNVVFALHQVESVGVVPYNGPVWNLTVEGSPTFQTFVGMSHNTQKPLDLMEWLVRLVTPSGGVVLDPFCGTGTTAVAAKTQGFNFVTCDLSEDYVKIAEARLAASSMTAATKTSAGYFCPGCKAKGSIKLLDRAVVETAKVEGKKVTCTKCMKRFAFEEIVGG
jgi:hypothetical protein